MFCVGSMDSGTDVFCVGSMDSGTAVEDIQTDPASLTCCSDGRFICWPVTETISTHTAHH